MEKRLTLVCFFLLILLGAEAQTTYCYHYYKHIDPMGVPDPRNDYEYITIKDDLLWVSEKDGSYKIRDNGERDRSVYKYIGEKVDGCFYYGMYEPQLMRADDPFGFGRSLGEDLYRMFYFLVPDDKSVINKGTRFDNGDTYIDCYELCPEKNCDKPETPSIPVLKR